MRFSIPIDSIRISILIVFFTFSYGFAKAQLVENSIPAPTNINQNECPCIMPDNSVVFQVNFKLTWGRNTTW
jgi:hypothetical protein